MKFYRVSFDTGEHALITTQKAWSDGGVVFDAFYTDMYVIYRDEEKSGIHKYVEELRKGNRDYEIELYYCLYDPETNTSKRFMQPVLTEPISFCTYEDEWVYYKDNADVIYRTKGDGSTPTIVLSAKTLGHISVIDEYIYYYYGASFKRLKIGDGYLQEDLWNERRAYVMDLMIIVGIMLLLGIILCTIGGVNDVKWASRVGGGIITLLILGGILFFWWACYSEDTAY